MAKFDNLPKYTKRKKGNASDKQAAHSKEETISLLRPRLDWFSRNIEAILVPGMIDLGYRDFVAKLDATSDNSLNTLLEECGNASAAGDNFHADLGRKQANHLRAAIEAGTQVKDILVELSEAVEQSYLEAKQQLNQVRPFSEDELEAPLRILREKGFPIGNFKPDSPEYERYGGMYLILNMLERLSENQADKGKAEKIVEFAMGCDDAIKEISNMLSIIGDSCAFLEKNIANMTAPASVRKVLEDIKSSIGEDFIPLMRDQGYGVFADRLEADGSVFQRFADESAQGFAALDSGYPDADKKAARHFRAAYQAMGELKGIFDELEKEVDERYEELTHKVAGHLEGNWPMLIQRLLKAPNFQAMSMGGIDAAEDEELKKQYITYHFWEEAIQAAKNGLQSEQEASEKAGKAVNFHGLSKWLPRQIGAVMVRVNELCNTCENTEREGPSP